jgi:hypothetical protein
MSTSLPTFQFGEVASASQLMAAFNVLWNQGENILNTLTGYRNMSLVDFQQQVEALNSRLQRANRISPPYTTVDFVTTDFLDIDQTKTSATVRADAQAVTLKERSTTTNAVIQNQTFATSDGTAEAISTDNSLYRVSTTDGSIPTGTFTLQLAQSLNMTVLTFDLAAMPPTPTIAISASPDGTTFTPAVQVSMNGYRLTAWFAPMEMLYITLAITPAAPDTLGGTSYTFGLTDFAGTETEFEMVSELVTKPIFFTPASATLKLVAPATPGILYFLSFNGGLWQEYAAGSIVPVPNTGTVSATGVTVSAMSGAPEYGGYSFNMPSGTQEFETIFLNSIQVTDLSTELPIRVAPALNPMFAVPGAIGASRYGPIAGLTHDYAAQGGYGGGLMLIPANPTNTFAGKTYSVSYSGVTANWIPITWSVQLKVQLSTSDRTVTPTFTGASLQEM